MKSFNKIKNELHDGDYELVANGLGISESLVRAVVDGYRKDRRRIQEAFIILIKSRGEHLDKLMRRLRDLREDNRVAA